MDWRAFETSLFGKASQSDGSPPVTQAQQPPSPFRQPMAWIKSALGLQSGNPPQVLDTRFIVPAMDTMQGGWPFAVYEGLEFQVSGPQALGFTILITPAIPNAQIVIIGLSVFNNSLGGPLSGAFRFVAPGGNTVFVAPPVAPQQQTGTVLTATGQANPSLAQYSVASGATATMQDIFSGIRYVVVPPGMCLAVSCSAGLVALGQWVCDVAWARIPAGFKV